MDQNKGRSREFIKLLCLSALFCALTTVATAYLPKIPTVLGYVHIGDVFVCLAGAVLPLPYSFFAGAIGGALADVLCSYAVYAPVTFFIKGITACFFKSIYGRNAKLRPSAKIIGRRNLLSLIPYILLCVGGYFLFEVIVYDTAGALAAALMNLLQGVASSLIFILFGSVLDRSHIFEKIERKS